MVKKMVSVLVALAMLLGCMGWTPVRSAEDGEPAVSAQPEQEAPAAEDSDFLERDCAERGMFRHIDRESFQRAGHVLRLPEEERLDTYVFQNRDGTKTVYYMGENVKYIAPDGSIREKDTTLVPVTGGYEMQDNDVRLHLPAQSGDGIGVRYNGYSIRLVPQDGSGEAELQDNTIRYRDFHGQGVHLQYTPMLSGVKEDIVLESYTGVSSFCFVLYTGGLGLYENAGEYYLAESENGEAVFFLGQIVVYDAVGCPGMGSMTVETLTAGQAYRLTVSADVDFLTAPATVYPVTIDPTITVLESSEGGVIEDAPVFSGYPNANFGTYLFNTIGYTDANYGIGRTVVRLNGLLADETFAALNASSISSVQFYMKDGGSNTSTVNIHGLLRNSSWTESTITWNTVGIYSLEADSTGTMGGGAWTAFDITQLAKNWISGDRNGQCGFMMVNAEEDTKKIGALSCEYGTGEYWPYVVVTYSLELALNYYSKDVDEEGSFQLIATTESANGVVTWESSDTSIASVTSTGFVTGHQAGVAVITASHTDASGETVTNSCTVYVTVADGLYYIKNAYSDLCMEADGSTVSIYDQVTNQEERNDQLWLITYIGTGRYDIQPLYDLTLALTENSGNYVAVGAAGETTRWGIVHNNLGYVIRYGDSSSDNARPVVSEMPGSQVYLGTWESNLQCHWELEKAYGIFLRDTKTDKLADSSTEIVLGIGRTCLLADLGISYEYYGSMIGDMTWSTSDSSIISVDAVARLTGVTSGEARIKVSATLNGKSYSYSCYVKAQSTVLVLSNSPEEWLNSSQIMGADLASAVGAASSYVQAVTSDNFADIWNNTTADHIIIHTHGSPNGLFGEALAFITQNISQLQRNSAIRFVLITACETGGDNNGYANIASLLSQCIAQEGVVVCSTTAVSGEATEFTAVDDDDGNPGRWLAYRNGIEIYEFTKRTITMQDVAEFWEDYR